jgi:hypothetical protein
MSSTINQSMSLFIAYVFPNISIHRIINIFQEANLGVVSRVDFIKKIDKNGKSFNNIYIHFHRWFESEEAQKFQDSIKDPEAKTTLQYDGPWFWIVLENTYKKQEKEEEPRQEQKEEPKQDQPKKKQRIDSTNMYRSLPPVTRKVKLDLTEDPVIKQIDSKMIERIVDKKQQPMKQSPLFKPLSYWHHTAEEILHQETSTLLERILEIQKEHAFEIESMKKQVPQQSELEYLREKNRQLQQELDSIKK